MEIHRSDYKHGIDADTIRHVLDHALTVIDLEPGADPPKVLAIGPDRAGRRGRPSMGSGPADVVPVRIDPELREAIEARAAADHTTTSEVIREAIRRFLEVA